MKTFFLRGYQNYVFISSLWEKICRQKRVFFKVSLWWLRDRLEEFERPFSIDVISGHYILRDRWRNLRDRFGPSKHLKKNTGQKSQKNFRAGLGKFWQKSFVPPEICLLLHQACNQGEGEVPPWKIFASPGRMCWTQFKNIGQSSKNLGPYRKTLRPSWCPKLVTLASQGGYGPVLHLWLHWPNVILAGRR